MRVTFYLTKVTGQELFGAVTLEGDELVVSQGADCRDCIESIAERMGTTDLAEAMRAAPSHYDGGYLRAEFEEGS